METLPGYYLGGNLYRPLGKRGKFPGVLITARALEEWAAGAYRTGIGSGAFHQLWPRQGYVVFAYDMVGYNDTSRRRMPLEPIASICGIFIRSRADVELTAGGGFSGLAAGCG